MTSRKSYPPTDLDQLLRDTLHAKVATQIPSNRVWRRIRRFLTGENTRGPLLRTSVIVQAIALLLVLSAVQTRFPLRQWLQQPTAVIIQPGKPAIRMAQEVAYVDTPAFGQQSPADTPLRFAEDKLLDAEVRRELIVVADKAQRPSTPIDNQPPIFVPKDSLPHNYLAVYRRPSASEPAVLAMVDVSIASGSGVIR